MPVTVIVRTDEAGASTSPSLTFDGPRVVIGRGAGCDVRLPDASVSHRHATLQVTSGAVTLSDEGSSNGTFVGKKRLSARAPTTIKSGELVRVGRVWLELRIEERPATRDLSMATKDIALALVARAMRSLGEEHVPYVRVDAGPDEGAELALAEEGRVYVIGRGDACDLALGDADASREHVQLVRRGGAILVRDRGSKNGADLEGVPLSDARDVTWKAGQSLLLANTVLVLFDPTLSALKSIEEADDEPLADADVPAPPVSVADAFGERSASKAPPAPLPIAPPSERPRPSASPPARRRPRGVQPGEAGLLVVALIILVLSLGGLFWLLRT
ncbi:MAG: FHA domain-containing protein [Myxococcales bacterium]|nr:FHA domain-containing protein [Myxococcales bacterium]